MGRSFQNTSVLKRIQIHKPYSLFKSFKYGRYCYLQGNSQNLLCF